MTQKELRDGIQALLDKIVQQDAAIKELVEVLEESRKMLKMDRPVSPLEIIEEALAKYKTPSE